ncbi:MAG: hypothetical protein JSU07_08905 [Bacteroidetes bacterium]|nr:hypothetical protein [Bacteroidota bacterium]
MNFTYGNNDQRIKMDYSINGANQYTRYYQGNYERQESAGSYKEWSYISTPSGPGAVYYNNNGTAQLLYITTDHLGSPIMLTDTNNNIVEEYSFDAWGRRRNPTNWSYSSVAAPLYMIRGFTMHEHLDEVGLINMNGRIYDPVLGRFIQADKITQDPSNTQNLNRYSYVMNNPLKYTDPSGYLKVQPNDNLGTGGPAQYGTLAQYVDAPVLYVDGARIEPGMGGYGFWLNGGSGGGGGISGISTLGNSSLYGMNITSFNSDYNSSIAALASSLGGSSFANNFQITSSSYGFIEDNVNNGGKGGYVQLNYKGNDNNGNSVFVNPVDGRQSINPSENAAYMQWTENAQSGGGNFIDGAGQVINAGGVIWGAAEMGLKYNGGRVVGGALGFEASQVANAAQKTLGVVSKVGKVIGVAGYGLSAASIGYKYATGQKVSTAENVSFGIGTVFVGAGIMAAGTVAAPFVAAGALIYGAFELGSCLYSGNTVEENIFGK